METTSLGTLKAINGILSTLVVERENSPVEQLNTALSFAFALGDVPLQLATESMFSLYQLVLGADVYFAHEALEGGVEVTPLWLRSTLLPALRNLAGHERGVLVLTGIRKGIQGRASRWGQAHEGAYQELIAYCEAMLLRHSSHKSRLQLIVL